MNKRGYTLIEIICTIAIIIISLSVINLDLDLFKKDILDSTIETIITDMQEAKMLAINSRINEVKVFFTLDEYKHDFNGYEIYIGGQNGKVLKKRKLNNDYLISRVKSTIPENGIVIFKPDGNISPHACTISVYDKNTNKYRNITLTIGYTRIMEVK
ncbi:MAG: hypothetical protein JG776_107 [Caloramator sp.]|uniref:prepilin-type N-terminal cleavage/methylation domain-containing protein n=1 Tax=Caloramator sp. TaxID=1871330 RepID=UPI001D5CF9A7|nr:prepilin-type N-terminal cleavage/methylation domain-containing protein [Caloramator sp.]MBZ4662425.1 hypothetical protein [Caloramator sp.]